MTDMTVLETVEDAAVVETKPCSADLMNIAPGSIAFGLIEVADEILSSAVELSALEGEKLDTKASIRKTATKVRSDLYENVKKIQSIYKGKEYNDVEYPGVIAMRDYAMDNIGSVKKANALESKRAAAKKLEAEIAALEAEENAEA